MLRYLGRGVCVRGEVAVAACCVSQTVLFSYFWQKGGGGPTVHTRAHTAVIAASVVP